MDVKKSDWKSYEQLAEKIYRKLEPEAVVTHDDSIYGHESGTYRQIDVSIRRRIAGHDILMIVQARDRARHPNVNDIGEFASVIQDVKASKGIMICRKRPGKNAARLAKNRGIDICSALDVKDRKWSDDAAVPVVVTLVVGELQPNLTFASGSGFTISLPPRPEPGYVSRNGGKTQTTLLEYMTHHVASKGNQESGTYEFVIQDDDLRILLNDCDWVPLPHLEVKASVKVRKKFRHCRAIEYLALKNYATGELTIAEMKLELPPFNDSNAWRDATAGGIYEGVTEDIPVLDLRLSSMARSNLFGLRILPAADMEYW